MTMLRYLHYCIGAVSAAALLYAADTANAVSVSQAPLFISTGATPNVMLLVDNSGSMDTIVWAEDYDPSETYPDWAPMIDHDCNNNTPLRPAWAPTDGNIQRGTLVSWAYRGHCGTNAGTTCLSGWTLGYDGGSAKCLRLPDPAGDDSTRYDGNYLNYLFERFAGGTNLTGGQIPSTTRMEAARNVAGQIVQNNANLRLGLSSFNPPAPGVSAPGARIDAACGTDTASLLSTIDGYQSETWTPLAEALYEITRYFRGMPSDFNDGVSYTSPIQYRCQKSFTVVITDGFPTYDSEFPNDDPADLADAERSLPNWDGLAPVTSQSEYPNFPEFSDGFQPQGGAADEAHTLYLDDIARFGHDIDLRPTGDDAFGESFNDPEFAQQRLSTYTVGFAISNQMLIDAAAYGDGLYFTADNESQLNAALQSAFADIIARTSSAASVAVNSTRLVESSRVFQARFNSADWSGELRALAISNDDGSVDEDTPAWQAQNEMPSPAGRNIFTYRPDQPAGDRGAEFAWSSLSGAQQAALDTNYAGVDDSLGPERLAYLRGDRGNEAPFGLGFRARSTVLGAIVNSDPAYAGKQDYGFEHLPGAEGSSYKAFRTSAAYENRPAMVYAAANDGMLHGFDAASGAERFAYMPNAVFANLSAYTSPAYNQNHRYLHDGSPRVMDAYLNGGWKTILVGSVGAAGRSIYGLDVTSPTSFGAGDVLWELSDADDADLGVSIPQATIARLYNGKWAALVGNGYNSASGTAMLLVIDLETGQVIRKIDTGVGTDNGLSSPLPVDVDGDRITDFVYAGDLEGNLWKFDLTAANPGNWRIPFGPPPNPQPLFTACSADPCTTGNRQPITARPEVGLDPTGGVLIYFGTGQYFAVGDGTTAGSNAFYAVRDRNTKGTPNPTPVTGGRAGLLRQQVIGEQQVESEQVRVTTDHEITASHTGWYLDLPALGERQVSTPRLRGGRVIFTTLIPSADPCGFGGTSWLMELDALSGSRLAYSPFDLNGDEEFNDADFAVIVVDGEQVRVPVSGRRSSEGIIDSPGIIADGGLERKYASGSRGGIDVTVENTGDQRGRQSWRRLQ